MFTIARVLVWIQLLFHWMRPLRTIISRNWTELLNVAERLHLFPERERTLSGVPALPTSHESLIPIKYKLRLFTNPAPMPYSPEHQEKSLLLLSLHLRCVSGRSFGNPDPRGRTVYLVRNSPLIMLPSERDQRLLDYCESEHVARDPGTRSRICTLSAFHASRAAVINGSSLCKRPVRYSDPRSSGASFSRSLRNFGSRPLM